MATLSEGLEWVLKANTQQLNKGIDDGKKKVKELEATAKKANDGMGKSFLKTKEAIEKVRGATLFYGAALVAIVGRAVQMQSALTKIQTAATLAGQKLGSEGLSKQVKAAASAMGTSFANAANQATDVMNKYQTTTTGALAAVTAAWKAQKLGISDSSSAIQGFGVVAKALQQDIGKVAETLGPTLSAAAAITKTSMDQVGGAVASLIPDAQRLGISTQDLVTGLVGLEQRGASVSQAQDMIATAMRAAIAPTEEQRKAFEALGLFGYNTIANVNGPNFLSFLQTATNAASTQSDVVGQLLGSTAGLNTQYQSGAGKTFADTAAQITAEMKKQDEAIVTASSNWDKLSAMASSYGDVLAQKVLAIMDKLIAATEWLIGAWQSLKDFISGAWDTMSMIASGSGSSMLGFASGGNVPGSGSGDTVPAMLTPGEFVVKKSVAQQMRPFLHAINSGGLRGFAYGGSASAWGGSAISAYQAYQSQNPIMRALARFGTMWGGGGSALLGSGSPKLGAASPMLGRGSPLLGAMQGSVFNRSPFQQWRFGMSYRFANGGDVPYASAPRASMPKPSSMPAGAPIGASSMSANIAAVNVNMRGAEVTPTFMRDRLLPAIQRETGANRSRWKRTAR